MELGVIWRNILDAKHVFSALTRSEQSCEPVHVKDQGERRVDAVHNGCRQDTGDEWLFDDAVVGADEVEEAEVAADGPEQGGHEDERGDEGEADAEDGEQAHFTHAAEVGEEQ